MGNPIEVYDKSDDENEYEVVVTPTITMVSTKLSRVDASMKEIYSKGENIVEKMGFKGGGLGPRGEGPWFPLEVPLPENSKSKRLENQSLDLIFHIHHRKVLLITRRLHFNLFELQNHLVHTLRFDHNH